MPRPPAESPGPEQAWVMPVLLLVIVAGFAITWVAGLASPPGTEWNPSTCYSQAPTLPQIVFGGWAWVGILLVVGGFGLLAFLDLRENGISLMLVSVGVLVAVLLVVSILVLQVLLTPLDSASAHPYALGMGEEGNSVSRNGAVFYVNLSLSPTSGMTTGMFGLKIATAGPILGPAPDGAPTACAIGPSTTVSPCVAAAGGWYGVLTAGDGEVLATYPSGSELSTSWNGGAVTLSSHDTLTLISSYPLGGTGAVLASFSTSCALVVGSTTL